MNNSAPAWSQASLVAALLIAGLQDSPSWAQDLEVLGVKNHLTTDGGVVIPLRLIELVPPPEELSGSITDRTDRKRGLRLELKSRFGPSFNYFYYQAEVHADDPELAKRIRSVEYVRDPPVQESPTMTTDASNSFRIVKHAFGTFRLTARVTLAPRYNIPYLSRDTAVEIRSKIPYPNPGLRPLPQGVKVAEASTYLGEGRYRWRLRLEGADEILEEISEVEYALHPTFPNALRRVQDRASGFALTEGSWGRFSVFVKVLYGDGSHTRVQWDLQLDHDQSPLR